MRRSPGRCEARSFALSSLALLGAACGETVVLGTECPARPAACEMPVSPSDASPDDDVPPDAGQPREDAGEHDSGPTGPVALFPPFGNPSFELSTGGFGALIPFSDNVSPWLPCTAAETALSVDESADSRAPGASGTPSAAETVLPSDGESFITASFALNLPLALPLAQMLETQLAAGQRYAFMIDVWRGSSDTNNPVSLELWTATAACVQQTLLASTGPVEEGGFRPVCVRFTPAEDVDSILLIASLGAVVSGGERVFFDNIREDPSCQ